MSVRKEISLERIKSELQKGRDFGDKCGWEYSEIDEEQMCFTIRMVSPVDEQLFILRIQFDDYPEIPLYLDFIDPENGNLGTKHAYPKKERDSFFHPHPCICNPSSRKAYQGFSGGPHNWTMIGWQGNPQTGTLKNLEAILKAIYSRISNPNYYDGRMA